MTRAEEFSSPLIPLVWRLWQLNVFHMRPCFELQQQCVVSSSSSVLAAFDGCWRLVIQYRGNINDLYSFCTQQSLQALKQPFIELSPFDACTCHVPCSANLMGW